MRILALETANEQCSVALYEQQHCDVYLDEREKMQTQTILPMIQEILTHHQLSFNDLTAIAFSQGPGSFSGVRINATVAQALAWGHDLPVIPISTLLALAQHAYQHLKLTAVTAVLDARMNEVYIANFQLNSSGIMQCLDQEKLLSYEQARLYRQFPCVGSGANLIDVNTPTSHLIMPTAQDIANIAVTIPPQHWVSAEQALPIYLRNDAWKKIPEQQRHN